jgi:hypothetical protein
MGAAAITTPVLTLQIPEQHDTYSLSSASPHERGYSPSPYPASGNGSYAGVAGIPLPSDIVQPWSQEHSRSTSAISTPISRSPTKSKSPSSPPPRYDMPVSSLAGAVVPHVAAMLPSWSFPIPQTQEEFDEDWEKWICYDQSPSPTIKGFGEQLRRFNRMLRAPRAMVGRRLAGKWDDENAPGDGGMKSSIKSSVKSSPSIICT